MKMSIKVTALLVLWIGCTFAFNPTTTATSRSRILPLPAATHGTDANRETTTFPASTNPTETNAADTAAFERAKELGSIVLLNVLGPLIRSLVTTPSNWDDFWRASANHRVSNAELVVEALEAMGATYVKFGQALSQRADFVPQPLADALARLQDDMEPFDTKQARGIIRHELTGKMLPHELEELMESLPKQPVAAASIGQVYKGNWNGQDVALKVKRPDIREKVEQDANMLRQIASWIESLPGVSMYRSSNSKQKKLIATKLVDSVDEFMSRVLEELDFQNEAKNMDIFAKLYCHRTGSFPDVKVVVPKVYLDLCTDNLIVMEWIEGSKLAGLAASDNIDEATLQENIKLIETGISATLSQLLTTGIMHADPHAGNLVKVQTENGPMLGFLDFGMLSTVPESVRDALVCAVAHVVFSRDVEAVAELFAELQLLPREVVEDPVERAALASALDRVFHDVLQYPEAYTVTAGTTPIPVLRFDKLLGGLTTLVARFQFSLPPYFVNIARALATLEGVARKLDPSFNALRAVYPYALDRILQNPSMSPIVENTLFELMKDPETGRIDRDRIRKIIADTAVLSETTRARILFKVLRSRSGKHMAKRVAGEVMRHGSVGKKRRRTGHHIFEL